MGASVATATAYIADITPPEKRAQNFGLIGVAFGIGFIAGPLVGGVLGEYGSRVPFYRRHRRCRSAPSSFAFFFLPESLDRRTAGRFRLQEANPIGAFVDRRALPGGAGAARRRSSSPSSPSACWKPTGCSIPATALPGGRPRSACRSPRSACCSSSRRAGWSASSCPDSANGGTINLGLVVAAVCMVGYRLRLAGWMIYAIIVPYVLGWATGRPGGAVAGHPRRAGRTSRASCRARITSVADGHRHRRPAGRRRRCSAISSRPNAPSICRASPSCSAPACSCVASARDRAPRSAAIAAGCLTPVGAPAEARHARCSALRRRRAGNRGLFPDGPSVAKAVQTSKTAAKPVAELTRDEAAAELARLAAEIAAHDRRYYQEDAPTVSRRRLRCAAPAQRGDRGALSRPEARRQPEPSGSARAPAGKFATVRHAVPMLSLENAFTDDDVRDFLEQVHRFLGLPARRADGAHRRAEDRRPVDRRSATRTASWCWARPAATASPARTSPPTSAPSRTSRRRCRRARPTGRGARRDLSPQGGFPRAQPRSRKRPAQEPLRQPAQHRRRLAPPEGPGGHRRRGRCASSPMPGAR